MKPSIVYRISMAESNQIILRSIDGQTHGWLFFEPSQPLQSIAACYPAHYYT